MSGHLEKGIHTPMAQGRSTKIISMIEWIRTSRLLTKKSLSAEFARQRLGKQFREAFAGYARISQNVSIQWFQKVNPPQNRQLLVLISNSKQ